MRKRCLLTLWLLSVGTLISAPSKHFIQLESVLFKYDSTRVLGEFYTAIEKNALTYANKDTMITAQLLFELQVLKNDSLWLHNAWKLQDAAKDSLPSISSLMLLDQFKLVMEPARYEVILAAQDLNNPARRDTVVREISVKAFPTDAISLSEVELASAIVQNPQAQSNPFYKNTLIVLPNPTNVFSPVNEKLFFYLESYFPESLAGQMYRILYSIREMDGKLNANLPQVRLSRKIGKKNRIEFGALDIKTLSSGSYLFNFTVMDSADRVLLSQSKKFFSYSPSTRGDSTIRADLNARFTRSEFAMMDEKLLALEFDLASYMFTTAQKKEFKALKTAEEKRRYLFHAWDSKDSNPSTDVNEYRMAYLQRFRYANDHFTVMKSQGWKGDRGRIYILYGPPSHIDRFPNEADLKPYDIWYYNDLEGGVQFVFGDLYGLGDYKLINSTLRGEIEDPNYLQSLGKQ